MSYIFEPNKRYRMPTHFGPCLGPRQGPNGRLFPCKHSPFGTLIQATFLADAKQFEKHVPPRFTVQKPCSVNISFLYRNGMEWLAGRGYNEFSISIPVTYNGRDGAIFGNLSLVIWENLADAIITGREDLGVAKLFCDLPQPQIVEHDINCRASWDGHQFASLCLTELTPGTAADLISTPELAGTFHYKYLPRTNVLNETDAQYVVLAPDDMPNGKLDEVQVAKNAAVRFEISTFEELPTFFHIVNALNAIDYRECTHASLIKYHGGKDLSDMKILS